LTVGSYTISNSTFSGNTADVGGATATFSGSYTISNSTFRGNTAGFSAGATRTASGSYTITNSTFSGNTAFKSAGATGTSGGSYTVTNSTLSSNTAGLDGGAIFTVGGQVTLTYATLADNSAPIGAHIAADSLVAYGSAIVNPQGGGANCNLSGSTISNGFNYTTDDTSCGLTGTGDTENGPDAQLRPLANNGGQTQTRLPAAGSPLIDAINQADCDPAVTVDQRGVSRPQDGACDIGAVEVQRVTRQAPVLSIWGVLFLLTTLCGVGSVSMRRKRCPRADGRAGG